MKIKTDLFGTDVIKDIIRKVVIIHLSNKAHRSGLTGIIYNMLKKSKFDFYHIKDIKLYFNYNGLLSKVLLESTYKDDISGRREKNSTKSIEISDISYLYNSLKFESLINQIHEYSFNRR